MNIIKKILGLLCAMGLVFPLTGCASSGVQESDEKPAVAIVKADTSNSQPINLATPLVTGTITDCAEKYGYTIIINCDGCPKGVFEQNLDIDPQYKNASAERLKIDARNKANNVLAALESVTALEPEVDFLEGLRLAAKSLSSLEGYTSKTIIVLGTGLSTTGNYVNFTNNLISADPESIADLLEEKMAIPDFTGMTVYWQGLAQTAAPQQPLTPSQSAKLQDIWAAIIARGGGTFVPNDYISIVGTNELVQRPAVSVVEFPPETPIEFEPEEADGELLDGPVSLPEEKLPFVPDSTKYLHPEEAEKLLKPIAEYLLKREDVTILLVGTTAGDGGLTDYSYELSLGRAETCKETLMYFGVDAERMITVGLGPTDPWHVSGVGYEGSLAASNRKVVIMQATSPLGKEILEK